LRHWSPQLAKDAGSGFLPRLVKCDEVDSDVLKSFGSRLSKLGAI
jgi:hypothetical protein